MRLKRGSVPLHYQLRETLRNQIVRGEYEPGDQFPTEKELREAYEVSQTTVRRAIYELAREGLLESLPGKGTFVRRTGSELDLGPLTSFSQEMQRRNLVPSNQIVRAEIIEPPSYVVEALQLDKDRTSVFCLERVRLANDQPLMLETAYVPNMRFPKIDSIDWEEKTSLIRVILETFHTPLIEIQEGVEPTLISEQHASLLRVEPFSLALHLSSILFTHQSEPFQYSDAIIPRQRAQYQVRFQGCSSAGDEATTLAGRSLAVVGSV